MSIKQKLESLATEKNTPCVTISLNTHRTHPDNALDVILLRNLINEAEERIIKEYGKREVASLLEKLSTIESELEVNYNLDSLHIYLSNDTKEIIKSAWTTERNSVQIAETFDTRSLIKAYNRSEEYFILLLSQSEVKLFKGINDGITSEIKNEDFPFPENRHYNTHSDKGSDPKHLDDLIREFLNKVDKALVKIHNETGLNCVVISTEDNYTRLLQVADKPLIYIGFANVDYNKMDNHHLAKQSWEIVSSLQQLRRTEAISEIKEAVGQGNVLTDLQEIYQASMDGRGELLIVHKDIAQSVIMTGERTFDLVNDPTQPQVIDDITSNIAWNLITKKGRVYFTSQEEIKEIGQIVLKTRY